MARSKPKRNKNTAGGNSKKAKSKTSSVSSGEEDKEMKTSNNSSWLYIACIIGILAAAVTAQVANTDSSNGDGISEAIAVYDHYMVLEVLPHDAQAFTQGLTSDDGTTLWEGTGNYAVSQLRRVDPATGTVQQAHALEDEYFGEGITFFKDADGNKRLIQITWQENKGFIYDAVTFDLVKEFNYTTKTNQGWGITYNDAAKEFIVTDGSEMIFFWDRDTLKEKRRMTVYKQEQNGGKKTGIKLLNEIEFVNGHILSNVWYQDIIVKIHPRTGKVVQEYDFKDLFTNRPPGADCFNGISITDKPNELWVTGKWWPHMYRVKLLV